MLAGAEAAFVLSVTLKLNSGMGLLTSITIGLALLADFLFLPPLLMKLEEKSSEKAVAIDSVAKPVST